jgi:hypothetical protein
MFRVRERTTPTERPPLVGEVIANFCLVVSVTDPYGRIPGFLDRSRYFFYQVAPQLYSRGWVDPVPEPLLQPNQNHQKKILKMLKLRKPQACCRSVLCLTLVLNKYYILSLLHSHGHSWCVCETGCSDWRGYRGRGCASNFQFLLRPPEKTLRCLQEDECPREVCS